MRQSPCAADLLGLKVAGIDLISTDIRKAALPFDAVDTFLNVPDDPPRQETPRQETARPFARHDAA
jgi:hypothetical protein